MRSLSRFVVMSFVMAGVSVVGVSGHPSPAAAAPVPGSSAFTQLPPTRVLDTRTGLGGTTGPLAPGTRFDVQITGKAGVPAGATSVALNLTAVTAARAGYITLYPAGGAATDTSNVNPASGGDTVANLAIVALPASGAITALADAGGQVIMDVAGYWMPAETATAGRFVPITPVRALDTRSPGLQKVGPGGQVNAKVAGVAGVPADARAVAVTVTAVASDGTGYITAWPAGQLQPNASISNQPVAGMTVANTAILPVGAGGQISIYSDGGAHILVDIAGWFTGDSAAAGSDGLFVPVVPKRIADSRRSFGMRKLPAGLPTELPVSIPGGIPAGVNAAAVAVNLTIVNPMDDGYLTASPSQVPVPNASNLNFVRDRNAAGLSLSRLGANGNLNLYSYSTAQVIADIAGWFTGAPAADGGFRPTKCENLFSYYRDDGNGQYSVVVADRTKPGVEHVVARGEVGGRIAQRCEYVLIFRPGPDAESTAISRVDVLGTQLERPIIGSLVYDTSNPSASGDVWYFLDGATSTKLNRRLLQLDVRSGVVSVMYDSKGNGLYDVSDVSPDGNTIYLTGDVGDGAIRPLRYTVSTGRVEVVGADWAHSIDISPDATTTAHVIHYGDDSSTAEYFRGNGKTVAPGVYRVRFTPQGEAVESHDVGPVTIRVVPGGASAQLLDDNIRFFPNFPEFALL